MIITKSAMWEEESASATSMCYGGNRKNPLQLPRLPTPCAHLRAAALAAIDNLSLCFYIGTVVSVVVKAVLRSVTLDEARADPCTMA